MADSTERVAVVGGGPAGSTAALVLARAGVDVDLIDAAAFPRDKACGDALLAPALREFRDLGLASIVDEGLEVTDWLHVAPDGDGVVATRSFTVAETRILPRYRLDALVRTAALDAGARAVHGRVVSLDVTVPHRPVLGLRMSAGVEQERAYRFVVGADGARSVVADRVRPAGRPAGDRAVSVRRYVRFAEPVAPRIVVARWDDERERGPGYEWALPVDDTTWNIGSYASRRAGGRGMASRLDGFVERIAGHFGAVIVEQGRDTGALLRYDFDADRCTVPGVALVGDAAGLCGAMDGIGIDAAVRSARLVTSRIVSDGFVGGLEAGIVEDFREAFTVNVAGQRQRATGATTGATPDVAPGGERTTAAEPESSATLLLASGGRTGPVTVATFLERFAERPTLGELVAALADELGGPPSDHLAAAVELLPRWGARGDGPVATVPG